MRDSMKSAIAEHIGEIPAHIAAIANGVGYSIMMGPCYFLIPQGKPELITDDSVYSLYEDAADDSESGDVIAECFESSAAELLRAYIEDLPHVLYYEDDSGCVSDVEPSGYWLEGEEPTQDEDESDEDYWQRRDNEWIEAPDYSVIDRWGIVESLFGNTIAREFR